VGVLFLVYVIGIGIASVWFPNHVISFVIVGIFAVSVVCGLWFQKGIAAVMSFGLVVLDSYRIKLFVKERSTEYHQLDIPGRVDIEIKEEEPQKVNE
jgi:hypothetical protein